MTMVNRGPPDYNGLFMRKKRNGNRLKNVGIRLKIKGDGTKDAINEQLSLE